MESGVIPKEINDTTAELGEENSNNAENVKAIQSRKQEIFFQLFQLMKKIHRYVMHLLFETNLKFYF